MVFKKKDPNAPPASTSTPSASAPPGASPVKTDGDAPPPTSAGASAPSASASADPDTPSERTKKKRLDVNPSLIINTEGGRSKRRRSPSPTRAAAAAAVAEEDELDPKNPVRAKELGMKIYNIINDSTTSDGESMSSPFHKLPNKRAFPDYYETIKHPMSLEMVHSKLEASEYQTLKDVCADLGQIFNNAKRYNVKESLIFLWAKKLHKTTRTFYATHTSRHKEESDSENETDRGTSARATTMQPGTSTDGRGTSIGAGHGAGAGAARGESVGGDADMASASADEGREKKKRAAYQMREGPTVYKLVKPVLKAVKEAVSSDGSGRLLSSMFEQLPDRKDLPDYYRTIKNPISLEEIEIKQTGRRYETYQEFFDDMELMCQNAMEYNADESEVFRDAKEIQDLMAQQLTEVQIRLAHPPGTKSYKIKAAAAAAAAGTPLRVGTMHTSTYPSASPSISQSPAPAPGGPPPLPPINYPPPISTPISTPTPRTATAYGSLPPGSMPYIPTLPPNVVTEDIVAGLERYTPYEQQAWLRSLSPYNMNAYRQLAAVVEARRRGAIAPPPLVSAPPPAPAQVQGQQMTAYPFQQQPAPVQQVQAVMPTPAPPAPKRDPPGVPALKFIDFAFTPVDAGAPASAGPAGEDPARRQAVRLRNFRGIVTHCVILNASTSDVEITAYPEALQANGGEHASAPGSLGMPDVTLRVNGAQGSLPKFVLGSAGGLPQGVKWSVHVPVTRAESKIEVLVTRAGSGTGVPGVPETTTIYVNRQY
ncbi:hypothetical protein IAT38_008067 [Cryptococcus sp. DSM 104549]